MVYLVDPPSEPPGEEIRQAMPIQTVHRINNDGLPLEELSITGLRVSKRSIKLRVEERDIRKFVEFLATNPRLELVSTEYVIEEDLVVDATKRNKMERKCRAYCTLLAPSVGEYRTLTARLIVSGSGHLVQGILWCGDLTINRLVWGRAELIKRIERVETKEIDKKTLNRIAKAKTITKMTKKAATGVLSAGRKAVGFCVGVVVNSKAGKKLSSLMPQLPGEVISASLEGFHRICEAVGVIGKEVLSTTSTVTTELVAHKYGEEAGKATQEGLGAAGNAVGTFYTIAKIGKAWKPKNALKRKSILRLAVKVAAAEHKAKKYTN